MEGKDVLLIATRLRLLAVDVTKLEILHCSDTEFAAPTLPVVQVFDFVDGGYAFGARFFMWGSKLYMAGGERTRWDASQEELSRPLGAGFPLESRASKRCPLIFVSDCTTPDSISKFSRANFRMITEKPSPIIVEFGGKLYVLSGPSWHYNHPLEPPTFEVYDPSLDEFEPLPDPPFYINNNFNSYDCVVAGYCLVQSSIYMWVGNRCYCYRIQDNQWDADETGVHKYALPCFSGQFVPGYDDIFICFRFHSLIAVILRNDGGHSVQYIDDEVFDPYYHPDSFSYKGLVVAMGGHGMCILKPVMAQVGNTNRCVLYVATFHVKKLDSSVDDAKRALTSAESSIAPTSKIAKMVTDSDIGTSHHHRGNHHSSHSGYHNIDHSLFLIKEFYVEDVRESDDSASLQESDDSASLQESDDSASLQESDPPPPPQESDVDDSKRALTSAESSIAPTSKIAKMVTDSDIGTSHHHRGNHHPGHSGYHNIDHSLYLIKEFYVEDVRESDDSASLQESDPSPPPQESYPPPPPQESDPSPPPQESDPPSPSTPQPFVSITCLSKDFYDLETWGPEIPYITSAFFHRWE
ncbi:hypothetical protein PVL29_004870 [Vitis rotundifolia]|uniref:Uncharacterized protein n=1 Tax=Vitis rotundifolia TaxID=103349 RepID=A0AA39AA18_VITRO|nr:hypothetical protein PVL29_004870 [Vitis rotundifolia]